MKKLLVLIAILTLTGCISGGRQVTFDKDSYVAGVGYVPTPVYYVQEVGR